MCDDKNCDCNKHQSEDNIPNGKEVNILDKQGYFVQFSNREDKAGNVFVNLSVAEDEAKDISRFHDPKDAVRTVYKLVPVSTVTLEPILKRVHE